MEPSRGKKGVRKVNKNSDADADLDHETGTGTMAANSKMDTRDLVRLISKSFQSIMLHSTNEDFRRTNFSKLKVTNTDDAEIVFRNKFLELCGLESDAIPDDFRHSEEEIVESPPTPQNLQSSNSELITTSNINISANDQTPLSVLSVPFGAVINFSDTTSEQEEEIASTSSEPTSSTNFQRPSMKRCVNDDICHVAKKVTMGETKQVLLQKISALRSLADTENPNEVQEPSDWIKV